MEKERDDYRAIAERRVRLGLLLSEIGQKNGVEVTQAEMQRLVLQAAQQYNPKDRERFVQYVQQDAMAAAQLRAPLYEDKVVDWLFDKAEITDRAVTREELEAAIEAEEDGSPKPHVHGPDCDHDHDHEPKAKKPAAKKAKAASTSDEKPVKKAPAKKADKADADKAEATAEAKPAAKKPAAKKASDDEAAAKPAKKAPAKKKA
jgi:trigger factor